MMFLDRVNPDNIPAGYGYSGPNKETILPYILIFIFIIAIIEGVCILYLLYQNLKLKDKLEKVEDKQEERKSNT